MKKVPDAIWLQIYGDDSKEDGLPPDGVEITWCADKINDSDVRYVIDKRYKAKGER